MAGQIKRALARPTTKNPYHTIVLPSHPISAKLFLHRMDCGRFTEKNEHRTSNVQHRTLNGKKGNVLISQIVLLFNNMEDKPNMSASFTSCPAFHYSLAQTGFSHGTGYYSDVAPGRANCERSELSSIFVTSIKTAKKKQK